MFALGKEAGSWYETQPLGAGHGISWKGVEILKLILKKEIWTKFMLSGRKADVKPEQI